MNHPSPTAGRALLVVSVLAVGACGSGGGSGYGGGGSGTGTSTGGSGTGGTTTLQANFKSIQDNVFTPICTACHIGASAPEGLRLDEANSFALLVGVASAEQPQLKRVDPGNPDQSYIIQKLEGTAAVGGRMPLNGTPLSQADIQTIRQWILDGAQAPMAAAPATAPIRVTTLSVVPDSTLSQLPMSIMVAFDRPVDASSIDTNTFVLERSGGDGTFEDGNEVLIAATSITVPAANPSSAVMDLSTAQSVPDTYRVTVVGAGASAILDLDSNALDGEFSGAFPSGDGAQGGDFVAEFTVAGVSGTLDSIQANVFTPICAGCHNGQGAALPGSMDLTSADASMVSLVGAASVEQPTIPRVKAGDPDGSYLVQKLEGTAATGARMPFGGQPLDPTTIDAIRDWIANGATR
ncbi:MAG TPA: hypothetical protein VFV10_15380 [Gammaproteobacteria bacterium]|nr:hypothetical protein [Gammaproteobacteria bacterium]